MQLTWTASGQAWGLDVGLVPGQRSKFEGGDYGPADAAKLRNGQAYQTVGGIGERSWTFGDAKTVNLVAVAGSDAVAVDVVTDHGPLSAASQGDALQACKALAALALSRR